MALTAMPFGAFLTDLPKGVHNVLTDELRVILLTGAYAVDYAAHASYADVKPYEVTGGGYTAGGLTLTNKSVTLNADTLTATLYADPVLWTDLAVTTRYAVVMKQGNNDASSPLIGIIDFGQNRVYDVEPFQLAFPSGVVSLASIA